MHYPRTWEPLKCVSSFLVEFPLRCPTTVSASYVFSFETKVRFNTSFLRTHVTRSSERCLTLRRKLEIFLFLNSFQLCRFPDSMFMAEATRNIGFSSTTIPECSIVHVTPLQIEFQYFQRYTFVALKGFSFPSGFSP